DEFEDRYRRQEPVVVAAPERRVEKEMAGLLEARQRTELGHPPLHVGMAGLPVFGPRLPAPQHLVAGEEAGRFHIDDEACAGIEPGEVAREHETDLVGEYRLAALVDH